MKDNPEFQLFKSQDDLHASDVANAVRTAHVGGFNTTKTTDNGHTLCGKHATSEVIDIFPDGSWEYKNGADASKDISGETPAMLKIFLSSDKSRQMYYEQSKEDQVSKVRLADILVKVAKPKKRQIQAAPRSLIVGHRKRVTSALTKYFDSQKARIVAQVVSGYTPPTVKKNLLRGMLHKALTPDELVAKVTLEGWDALIGESITPEVEAAFNAAGMSALEATGIAIVDTMTSLVNEAAISYASELAADLVTQIEESTRQMIRDKVVQAIAEGWDSSGLSEALADSRAFSPERSELIADYELGSALEAGNLSGWQASGVVKSKQWLTAEDELVSDDCQMNADQGEIPLDDEFQSGDDVPLAHPYCRCVVVGVVDDNGNQDQEPSED